MSMLSFHLNYRKCLLSLSLPSGAPPRSNLNIPRFKSRNHWDLPSSQRINGAGSFSSTGWLRSSNHRLLTSREAVHSSENSWKTTIYKEFPWRSTSRQPFLWTMTRTSICYTKTKTESARSVSLSTNIRQRLDDKISRCCKRSEAAPSSSRTQIFSVNSTL